MKLEDIPSTSSPEPGTLFATANSTLLAPYALDMKSLQNVLGSIMKHKVDYADLYFQYSRSESWGLEEGQVKSDSFSIDWAWGCGQYPARKPLLPIPTTSACLHCNRPQKPRAPSPHRVMSIAPMPWLVRKHNSSMCRMTLSPA